MYAALLFLHILGVTLWVGGMAFAHFALRPAVQSLEVPTRLNLMADVLGRFLNIAGIAVLCVLISGFGMFFMAGGRAVPVAWHIMAGLGCLMALIYGHIRFALFMRLRRAVAAQTWPEAATALGKLRQQVSMNLLLGLLTIAVATLVGRA